MNLVLMGIIYGCDKLSWPGEIKEQYLSEQASILKSTADHPSFYSS